MNERRKPYPFDRIEAKWPRLPAGDGTAGNARPDGIDVDALTAEHGADAVRLYAMSAESLDPAKPWSETGVQGMARFLARVWRLAMAEDQEGRWQLDAAVQDIEPTVAQRRAVHATIKKVTADMASRSFHTAISQMMVCTNELTGAAARPVSGLRALLRLLNPFAPHLTEELWEALGGRFPAPAAGLLASQPWPVHDEAFLIDDEIELPVQINGKLRDRITVSKDLSAAGIEAAVLASARVREHLGERTPRKMVIVPGKLINIVL